MADLYAKTSAASTQGISAIACILVLWPTWIIWKLKEQKVMAMAPPAAMRGFIPNASINKKPPSSETKSQFAGRLPAISPL